MMNKLRCITCSALSLGMSITLLCCSNEADQIAPPSQHFREMRLRLTPGARLDYKSAYMYKLEYSSLSFHSADSGICLRVVGFELDTILYDDNSSSSLYGAVLNIAESFTGTFTLTCLDQSFDVSVLAEYPVRYVIRARQDSIVEVSTEFMRSLEE